VADALPLEVAPTAARQVTGDTKYGTVENIVAVEDMGIRAYVPLPDWEQNSAYFRASKFIYDAEHDQYTCPNSQVLRRTHTCEAEQRVLYRARASACRTCPLKAECTPATKLGRSTYRSFGEECLERVQAYQPTAAYQKALSKRKVWVEPLFAEAKQWHGLRRFRLRRLRRLRRLWRVNSEALLTAAGQNLMRLLAKHGWGRRPLPAGAAVAARQFSSLLRSSAAWRSQCWATPLRGRALGPRSLNGWSHLLSRDLHRLFQQARPLMQHHIHT